MRCLDSITNSVDMNLCKLWEIMEDREVWHATIHGVSKSIIRFLTEQQQLFSHKKKKKLPLVTIWIDLEDIMLNEISQMEKDKYFILSHICAIKKKKANAWI